MARIAVVAPETRWRGVLAGLADAGVVEPDRVDRAGEVLTRALEAARRDPTPSSRNGGRHGLDLDRAVAEGREELIAGEAELDRVTGASVTRAGVRAVGAWAPAAALAAWPSGSLPWAAPCAELPAPSGQDPPTLLNTDRGSGAGGSRMLVDTYATVPYRDVDPTWFAIAAYVVMFGMMFGDVGDGALLVVAGLWLRRSRRPRWPGRGGHGRWSSPSAYRHACSALLYGEFFGPTGVVPDAVARALWTIRPACW